MQTQIIKYGELFAVCIPKELIVDMAAEAVEIEREGENLIIKPAIRHNLAVALDAFAAFPPNFMVEGRGFHEQKERDWK